MKKFFQTLLVILTLTLGAAFAEQRDTTTQYVFTVSSRKTVYNEDGSVLGWTMQAVSGTHSFSVNCLKQMNDCYPLNPNTGNFYFYYLDSNDPRAYPSVQGIDGSMIVTTGDGTKIVFFYIDE